ncbi:hypothetical protein BHE74_00040655 [Ensete ventricosum]|nr:hypothetical protein GW17_00048606 [Ensete ventricosum]RWW52897.1 hypothetical protein BHE74_00040655 [Ensete ventricosum]
MQLLLGGTRRSPSVKQTDEGSCKEVWPLATDQIRSGAPTKVRDEGKLRITTAAYSSPQRIGTLKEVIASTEAKSREYRSRRREDFVERRTSRLEEGWSTAEQSVLTVGGCLSVITDLGHCGIGGCRKSPLPVDMGNDWKSRKRSSRRKKQQPEEIDGADAVVAGGTTERGRRRLKTVTCYFGRGSRGSSTSVALRGREEGDAGVKAEEQSTVRRNEEKSDGVTDLDDRLWLQLGEETLVAGRRNKTLVEPSPVG